MPDHSEWRWLQQKVPSWNCHVNRCTVLSCLSYSIFREGVLVVTKIQYNTDLNDTDYVYSMLGTQWVLINECWKMDKENTY